MADVSELISAERIALRTREVAREVVAGGEPGRSDDLLIVVLLSGGFIFAADLIRAIGEEGLSPTVDFMALSSYGDGTESRGEVEFRCETKSSITGRDVLIVDDIADSGRSLAAVKHHLQVRGAHRVRTCVLLDKPSRRVADIRPDYLGFEVPDRFVVGYGLDYAERFRHLPYVGVIEE